MVVIVDTSVWITHLRKGNTELETLLFEADVACHPYIVGELACGNIANRTELLTLLQALPMLPVITQDEFLYFVDSNKLMGSGVGFVDVHLLASSRLMQIPILTEDTRLKEAARRLKLMYS